MCFTSFHKTSGWLQDICGAQMAPPDHEEDQGGNNHHPLLLWETAKRDRPGCLWNSAGKKEADSIPSYPSPNPKEPAGTGCSHRSWGTHRQRSRMEEAVSSRCLLWDVTESCVRVGSLCGRLSVSAHTCLCVCHSVCVAP